jgi:hypothetical protein
MTSISSFSLPDPTSSPPTDLPRREAEILRLAEQFAAAPREGVSVRNLGGVLFRAGAALLQYGERSRAEELFAQANELATKTHDAPLLIPWLRYEIIVATVEGDLDRAVRASEQLGGTRR